MTNKIAFTTYLAIALAFTVAIVLGLSYLTIDGFTIAHITGCVAESATGTLEVVPCQ